MELKADVRSGVLVLTIHRPRSLNALNRDVLEQLSDRVQKAAADRTVKVIVITGEGEKAFAAGADIAELAAIAGQDEAVRVSSYAQETFLSIERLPKPVIAAINGYALGGGLELALACDIRFASERAKLGLPEVTLGLLPGFGGTQRMLRLLGRGAANYWMMSGEMMSAEEARQIGLVEKVFAHELLLEKTLEFAGKLAMLPPRSLAAIKDCVNRGADAALPEALAIEAEHFGSLLVSRDGREGTRAFLEKRTAVFTGE